MKILLMGDASNYHRTLGDALLAAGHKVVVASSGTQWMKTARDIDLSRSNNRLGGAILYLKARVTLAQQLRGYDIVHICSPLFIELKPCRVAKVFDDLRRYNGRVYLTALGTDSHYVERCCAPDAPLAYSEWRVNGRPSDFALSDVCEYDGWLAPHMRAHCDYIYDNVDGAVTALYEYQRIIEDRFPASRLAYGGIPIDLSKVRQSPLPPVGINDPVRIMVAYPRARMVEKGADRLLAIVREVERRNPGKVVVDEVTQLPYSSFVERIRQVHIVVDQMYSYTPATTALLAMAMGRVVVSGGEEEYYDFIGERELRPVVNTAPDDDDLTMHRIEALVRDRDLLLHHAGQGREFVARHNDAGLVARRYLDFWERQ